MLAFESIKKRRLRRIALAANSRSGSVNDSGGTIARALRFAELRRTNRVEGCTDPAAVVTAVLRVSVARRGVPGISIVIALDRAENLRACLALVPSMKGVASRVSRAGSVRGQGMPGGSL